jgi:hypothetical protein
VIGKLENFPFVLMDCEISGKRRVGKVFKLSQVFPPPFIIRQQYFRNLPNFVFVSISKITKTTATTSTWKVKTHQTKKTF